MLFTTLKPSKSDNILTRLPRFTRARRKARNWRVRALADLVLASYCGILKQISIYPTLDRGWASLQCVNNRWDISTDDIRGAYVFEFVFRLETVAEEEDADETAPNDRKYAWTVCVVGDQGVEVHIVRKFWERGFEADETVYIVSWVEIETRFTSIAAVEIIMYEHARESTRYVAYHVASESTRIKYAWPRPELRNAPQVVMDHRLHRLPFPTLK